MGVFGCIVESGIAGNCHILCDPFHVLAGMGIFFSVAPNEGVDVLFGWAYVDFDNLSLQVDFINKAVVRCSGDLGNRNCLLLVLTQN